MSAVLMLDRSRVVTWPNLLLKHSMLAYKYLSYIMVVLYIQYKLNAMVVLYIQYKLNMVVYIVHTV